jgi:Ca2+-binding EF-hand superfamily protein
MNGGSGEKTSIRLKFQGSVGSVDIDSGATDIVTQCASVFPAFDQKRYQILGLKQGRSIYPIRLIPFNPSLFSEGTFELIYGAMDTSTESNPRTNIMNSAEDQASPLAFWLSPSQRSKVSVSFDDVYRLKRLSAGAALLHTAPPEVYNILNTVAIDGLVDDDQYGKFCSHILSRVETDDHDFIRGMLDTLFSAFDRTGNGMVDLDELASGFSLMTRGSKSDKLALAFDVFDGDNDGLLSRRELWKFLRAFLSVILEFSDARFSMGGIKQLHDAVDEAAVEMTAIIFKTLGLRMANKISFEAFGHWYNSTGHAQMPWLELLDMRKWPDGPANADDTSDQEEESDSAYSMDTNETGEDNADAAESLNSSTMSTTPSLAAIFEFNLGDDIGLRVCNRDVENLNALLELTGLHERSALDLQNAISSVTGGTNRMTKKVFDQMIRNLKPGDDLNSEEKMFLSFAFSSYFFAFDRHGEDEVETIDFANGFTVLAGGSKSDKLALAFQNLELDGDKRVQKRQLWRFLRSFLTMLAALTEQMSTAPSGDVAKVIHNTCVSATESIFEEAKLETQETISFEEFADWYTNGGFQLIPWLELLDLKKWPYEATEGQEINESSVESVDVAPSSTNSDANATAALDEDSTTSTAVEGGETNTNSSIGVTGWISPIFEFILNSTSDKLVFFPKHVEGLRRFIRLTGLGDMDPTEILMALSVDNQDGRVDSDGYMAAMHNAVDLQELNEADFAFVTDKLERIFDSFSYFDDAEDVSVKDLVAGLTIFTEGSKSEKLGHIFDLFCEEKKDSVSRSILFEYLRAFLMVLASLSDIGSIASFPWAADQGAAEAAQMIFEQVGKDGNSDEISFSEFAEWYSTGGFQVAPWLELLDMRKWPGPTFEFVLTASGDTLCIFPQDIEHLGNILSLTNLDTCDAVYMCEALSAAAQGSLTVDKPSFDAFIRFLVPGDNLSDEEKTFLSFALTKIFYAFAKDDGTAALDELTCGMILLGHGSKSDKLSMAFQTMNSNDDDSALKKRDMWRYLRSFLTVLFALSSNSTAVAQDMEKKIVTVLHNASVEVTEQMFTQADTEEEGSMRFEEFADWYTYGGFEIIPWLELLDLKKWPSMLPFAPVLPSNDNHHPTVVKQNPHSLTSEDEQEKQEQKASDYEDAALVFQLGSGRKDLTISPRDVEKLQLILDLTMMDSMSCSTILEAFSHPTISKPEFDKTIVSLVDGNTLSKEEKRFLSHVLSRIYFAYVSEEDDAADGVELGSGFSLFASGSKSEKLALAFQQLSCDDSGRAEKSEFQRYLRAFLTVLAALTDLGLDTNAGMIVDDTCVSATDVIFSEAKLAKPECISFEEFADWYTDGGYQLIPWLELLDLKKWPYAEEELGN